MRTGPRPDTTAAVTRFSSTEDRSITRPVVVPNPRHRRAPCEADAEAGCLLDAFLICSAGCAASAQNSPAGTRDSAPTTAVALSGMDPTRFRNAVSAVSQGLVSAQTPTGVAQAHQRIDAIAQSAPAQIRGQAAEMAVQYNAVVDATRDLRRQHPACP